MEANTSTSLHPHRILFFSLIVAVFLILAFVYGRIVIQNDGISYYALTISLVQDGDFNLQNQAESFPELRFSQDRGIGSLYSCGFAILYAPFVSVSEGLSNILPALKTWRPYSQNARFPFPDSLGIFVGSILYGILTVFLSWFLLIERYQASPFTGFWISFAVFAGTSLMFYTLSVPSFVQAADTFLVTAAIYFALLPRSLELFKIRFRNVLLGFFLALSVLVRNNNIVLIPSTVAIFAWFLRGGGTKSILRALLEIFVGALPVAIVQAHFNYIQYGSQIATGYPLPVIEEWKDYVLHLLQFYKILIDPGAGLFWWSPITILALIGLFVGVKRRSRESLLALVTVAVVVLSVSFYGWIYGGTSFGQRFLTHLYICWVIGVYELTMRWKRPVKALAVICALWTFLLMNSYFIAITSSEGRKLTEQSYSVHSHNPTELVAFVWNQYRDSRKNGQTSNPIEFWFQSLNARPYPTVQYILRLRS